MRHDDSIRRLRAAAIWPGTSAQNPTLSTARRVRRAFSVFGLIISILVFVVVGAGLLFDQWIEGLTSPLFMFGTACLIGGFCLTLFAVVSVIGLLVSSAFSDAPRR